MTLNKAQQQATEIINGHVICQASAGTGKTFAMTHRIKAMIEKGINPQKILAFTFTKKAGDELKEKLNNLIGDSFIVDQMSVGTIHSVFFKILRMELPQIDPHFRRMSVIKDWQQKKILKNSFKDLFTEKPDKYRNPQIAGAQISLAKNNLLTPEGFEKYLESLSPEELDQKRWLLQMYREYERRKTAKHLIDFDDMLLKTFGILSVYKSIREKWKSEWDYVLVDEFQDTNTAQYEIIKILIEDHKNLFVVGDIKQAIYEWRGAKTSYIDTFAKTFNAKSIFLEETYRNSQEILSYANRIARIMKEKPIRTSIDGGEVKYLGQFTDPDSEAKEVATIIKELIGSGASLKDFKILYRVNSQSRAIEESLIRSEIPYIISGGFSFFDRSEVKDMISYLKIFLNPEDSYEEYRRIYNKPNRMLGRSFFKQFDNHYDRCGSCVKALTKNYSRGYMSDGAMKLREIIKYFQREIEKQSKSVSDILFELRSKLGYDDWLVEQRSGNGDESQTKKEFILENLLELQSMSQRFATIEKMLDYIAMLKDMKKKDEDIEAVQLMTIHKSKGLEADNVFLIGCNEGILPHSRSKKDAERRLMYVSVTRAAERLFISSVIEYQNKTFKESSFLEEMDLIECFEEENEAENIELESVGV